MKKFYKTSDSTKTVLGNLSIIITKTSSISCTPKENNGAFPMSSQHQPSDNHTSHNPCELSKNSLSVLQTISTQILAFKLTCILHEHSTIYFFVPFHGNRNKI